MDQFCFSNYLIAAPDTTRTAAERKPPSAPSTLGKRADLGGGAHSNILSVREAACLFYILTPALISSRPGTLLPRSSNPEKLIFYMRMPLEKWGDRPEVIKLISGLRAGTQAVC